MIHSDVRNYILQGELGDRRIKWITKINRYDVEVRPTKVIKGKVLCQ